MAQQIINIGAAPNDTTGDTLREGGSKINANFTELYGSLVGPTDWSDIENTPTTLSGYGITNAYTVAEVNALISNFETTSQLNSRDAANRNRANHTGTQLSSTISDFASAASSAAPVQSVAGKTGTVTLVKADVGLSNVDNTADIDKPISTAVQTALNLKADTSSLATVATSGAYADLTGSPTIPFGFTYDQITEPSSPTDGQTWVERHASGLIKNIWERIGTRWVSVNEQVERSMRATASTNFTDVYSSTTWSGPGTKEIYLTYYYVDIVLAGTHDESNFYNLELKGQRLTPTGSIADITPNIILGPFFSSTVVEVTTPTIISSAQPGTYNRFQITGTRVGNPGSIAHASKIKWREIRG